jgi:hypothetical protein
MAQVLLRTVQGRRIILRPVWVRNRRFRPTLVTNSAFGSFLDGRSTNGGRRYATSWSTHASSQTDQI